MKTSLSVRIAESPRNKSTLATPLNHLLALAHGASFTGISVRASAVSVDSPESEIAALRRALDAQALAVSMVTGNLALAKNDSAAPSVLRDIHPHLDLAERLGAKLVRVMAHTEADITHAQRAADAARERGLTLAHQCHWGSLAETVDDAITLARKVGRENFRITYEPANLQAAGSDYGAAAIRRLAPYLANVYFQNVSVDPKSAIKFPTRSCGEVGVRFLPLGHPNGLDMVPVVAELKRIGYEGWFTIHQPLLPEQSISAAVADAGRYVGTMLGHPIPKAPRETKLGDAPNDRAV